MLVEQILQPLALSNTAPNPEHPAAFALTGFNRVQFMDRMAARYELRGALLSPIPRPDCFGVSAGLAVLPYGLGWFIQDYQGERLQWHYGYWSTNSSLIVRAPERGLSFVVLANTPQLSALYNLGIDNNVMRLGYSLRPSWWGPSRSPDGAGTR